MLLGGDGVCRGLGDDGGLGLRLLPLDGEGHALHDELPHPHGADGGERGDGDVADDVRVLLICREDLGLDDLCGLGFH